MKESQLTIDFNNPPPHGDEISGFVGETEVPPAKTYRVGTLVYTKIGLVTVFFWLLWGDFCFTLMETALPKLLPLKLKSLGTSNLMVGLLAGSIPNMMSMVVTPIVGYRSDRYRGTWGRRIPFLFWPTPFVALFLILLGYAEEIGLFLHRVVFSGIGSVSSTVVVMAIVSVFIAVFTFFNLIVVSVYYYLIKDVVPDVLIGRFMALFRVISAGAIIIFHMFIFGCAEKYMREIFLGVALLYLVGFLLMCWKVKEGQYPPPPEQIDGLGFFPAIKTYFRECFSHRYYIYFFIGTSLWSMAGACSMYIIFFCQSLNMNLDQIGKITAWLTVPTMILLYPMGVLADRFNPLRVIILSILLLMPLSLASFFFIHDVWSYVAISVISLPFGAAYGAAYLPMFMTLLPKERFGQFYSAQLLVSACTMIVANFLMGGFLDLMKYLLGADENYYRYIYIWSAFFQMLSLIFMLLVYREWKNHGGIPNYVPPLSIHR